MKRIITALLLALTTCAMSLGAMAESFDPSGLIDWYNDSTLWMSVDNGHWSEDPADKPTQEDLEKIFSMTMKSQSGGARAPWFFIVIEDVEEQRKALGDYVAPPEFMATEGTVTILAMADHIMTEEQGHVEPYGSDDTTCGSYNQHPIHMYDIGMAAGIMEVAAASLGYNIHVCGALNGEHAPMDITTDISPNFYYQTMNYYVKPEYKRTNAWYSTYGEPVDEQYVHDVAGNSILVVAIVMGKPKADESVETWGSYRARPDNWAIWDGEGNEEPSPSVAAQAAYAANKPAEEEAPQFEVGENEYIGSAMGVNGLVYVKVTLDGDAIANVEIVQHNESEVAKEALETLPAQIVEAQSTDVDTISGCTIASNAIKAAAKDALKKAGIDK